jgi:hypothetical protein
MWKNTKKLNTETSSIEYSRSCIKKSYALRTRRGSKRQSVTFTQTGQPVFGELKLFVVFAGRLVIQAVFRFRLQSVYYPQGIALVKPTRRAVTKVETGVLQSFDILNKMVSPNQRVMHIKGLRMGTESLAWSVPFVTGRFLGAETCGIPRGQRSHDALVGEGHQIIETQGE